MLKLKFLDVGLGTSTFIQTDKLNIVFDCGQDSSGKNAFKELKSENLDYLIMTHPHKDHIEALISPYYKKPTRITRNGNIPEKLIEEQISNAKTEYDKQIFRKYKRLDEDYTSNVNNSESYMNPKNNGNVVIQHFYPSKLNNVEDLNYYSLTTFLSYGKHKFLLMGDNTLSNIDELLGNYEFRSKTRDVDILLAPHHGRKSCFSQELLKHLNPKISIISDKPEDNEESAQDRYSYYSRGLKILEKGKFKFRTCLTTRKDGEISVLIKNEQLFISC